jgi:stearoyl-CoA desaturase (delta-9 desaturase)
MSTAIHNEEPSPHAAVGVMSGGWEAVKKRIENTILIGVPLAGSIAAPFWIYENSISWIEITAFLWGYAIIGLGIGLGFHRYFSHKSYKPKRWIAWLLGAAGSMAFQGSVLRWIADHRRHHAHTDDCGDVHSPYVDEHCEDTSTWTGLFHAHIGWMFDSSVTDYKVFAKDLLRDPLVMFFHKTHWLWPALSLVLPWAYGYALGGVQHAWGCLLIGGCLRTTVFHNVVWAVNSIGHTWGYETYTQGNNSKNNQVLALLTFGDGWHNNHHQFPRSAFHGLTDKELDINGLIITGLEKAGLVSDVVRVPAAKLG